MVEMGLLANSKLRQVTRITKIRRLTSRFKEVILLCTHLDSVVVNPQGHWNPNEIRSLKFSTSLTQSSNNLLKKIIFSIQVASPDCGWCVGVCASVSLSSSLISKPTKNRNECERKQIPILCLLFMV